ncbi:glycosyltransferase family 4 protein [Rhodococcus tukisamuensis]|uniref:Glycosyltransferase involved in cell wall bisynthesis n=1 Tax=Rhodococcus tukisamuensis TaxID=168276 RepID=A0A1G7AMN5_9NOCA|nr:glycosyltransferase family 4 protein [Rhodococcus tukisamuensis]SDE16052.1 Glycosyltransferase involved in cell wall bisynthesis [Rhodococcus tukisamuensis]
MDTRRVLIIVQNLPVPLDRRVWLECNALTAQGYIVTVICPKGPGDPGYEVVDGVAIYKYPPAPEARGLFGYALEFVWSWLRTAILSVRVRRERGFDVIQACNPPDTYWLLAWLWRTRSVRFVFDHHDLNPELFVSRFGEPRTLAQRMQYRGLLWLERMTMRVADQVISTNCSYQGIAESRGHCSPESVTVVRSGPDTRVMRPIYPDPDIRAGAEHLLVYLGIMGPQDGVEIVLDVADELVRRRGREGIRVVLMGFGDCLQALRARCTELGLDDVVHFTGRVGPPTIAQYLSAADVGVGPDQKTPLNDVSTMNKTMEYMAYALPSVSFDLVETRRSAGDAGILVPSGDLDAFATAVERLLDDAPLRTRLGAAARRRAVSQLDWRPQAQAYVGVFDELFGRDGARRLSAWPFTASSDDGVDSIDSPQYVDLDDEAELRRFIVERTRRPRTDELPSKS